jgi:hypothetical protein
MFWNHATLTYTVVKIRKVTWCHSCFNNTIVSYWYNQNAIKVVNKIPNSQTLLKYCQKSLMTDEMTRYMT